MINKYFISFEGGEGTGKSTVSKIIQAKLKELGYEVLLTREPGNNLKISQDIRNTIMNNKDLDPLTELLLFCSSIRENVIKTIDPALKEGKIVIADRFIDSTKVYQGIVKGVDTDIIDSIIDNAVQDIRPSLVFIFDLNPKIGLKRINNKKREINRFDKESLSFHKKIRIGYKSLYELNKDKYIIVDANKETEKVVEFILDKIIKKIKK